MIVAIYKNNGTGTTRIREFCTGPSVAECVTHYRNETVPPRPDVFSGLDTGWAEYQYPPQGTKWGIDVDDVGAGLINLPAPPTPERVILTAPNGSRWKLVVLNTGALDTEAL